MSREWAEWPSGGFSALGCNTMGVWRLAASYWVEILMEREYEEAVEQGKRSEG